LGVLRAPSGALLGSGIGCRTGTRPLPLRDTGRRMSLQNVSGRAPRDARRGHLGIAVAIAVVLLLASGCGSTRSSHLEPPRTPAEGPRAEVASLLAGIPQSGNTLGNPKAPVTLQYFGDLECPFCRQFTLTALPSIIRRWVRGGSLKIEYRSEQTATTQATVFKFQQLAALAAGQQNKMWDFIELFYHEQGEEDSGYVTEKYLQGLAQQVPGLNLVAWTAARNDPTLASTLTGDRRAVKLVGFTGTPSFLIGRTGGEFLRFRPRTNTDPRPYNLAIETFLKGRLSPRASSSVS
jgi:protein-disulfide isomerase